MAKEELSSYQYRKIYKDLVGPIPKGWHIHHIDWDKTNNSILNLIALPRKLHQQYHYHLTVWATSIHGEPEFFENNKGSHFNFIINIRKDNNKLCFTKNEKSKYSEELNWLLKYFELKNEINEYIDKRDSILLKKGIIYMNGWDDYYHTRGDIK